GIGKETAKELARRKARVIIACRNIEKARKAAREIFEDTEQQVTIKPLDLQSFKSIREFANDIINTEPRLDVLINNAGMANESRNPDLTEDGCEPCFQANYLGHFLLTVLLAGLLRKSAPSRVVNVSSVLHLVGSVDHLEQKMLGATRPHKSLMVYADSKLAQVVFTRTLARKLKRDGVTVNVLQPGTVKTDILKPGNSIIGLTIFIMAVLFGKVTLFLFNI
ncbi:dehydrogenase, putative, partial [Ixodes scapularis]